MIFYECRSYEEVPWDNMLPAKQWAPVSTLEERPDMISQTYPLKRYDPAAQEWQVCNKRPNLDLYPLRLGNKRPKWVNILWWPDIILQTYTLKWYNPAAQEWQVRNERPKWIHVKQWAPVSTLEERPDMISQTYTLKRYDTTAQEWQVGNKRPNLGLFLWWPGNKRPNWVYLH